MIKLFDVCPEPELEAELERRVLSVFRSGRFILGEEVETFEAAFAEMFGATYAVGVASGTDALVLGLRALGIGPGDEVIVPALTFYASAEAVLQVGAEPVVVDVDEATLTLSPEAVEGAITAKTAALLPVHLYGQAADMPRLAEVARRYNLLLVEDAAQAVGAKIAGRYVGQWGDVCCYSFYPTKNLAAAGDAGLVTTPHQTVAAKVRQLRVHAQHGNYFHDDVGYTSRLDALQAAVLNVKLPQVESWNRRRRELARCYDQAFEPIAAIQTPQSLGECVYHLYNVRAPQRDEIIKQLQARGIESRVYYPHTLETLPPLKGKSRGSLTNAHAATRELLALPLRPNLTVAEQQQVITALEQILAVDIR